MIERQDDGREPWRVSRAERSRFRDRPRISSDLNHIRIPPDGLSDSDRQESHFGRLLHCPGMGDRGGLVCFNLLRMRLGTWATREEHTE